MNDCLGLLLTTAAATTVAATVGGVVAARPRLVKAAAIALLFAVALIGSLNQPAIAAVNDAALNQDQKEFQDALRTNPKGTQYVGLEYAPASQSMSDRQIEDKIRSNAPEDLKLSVSSGSVRVSGRVADRQRAQELVRNIKDIPGVHEVSYDLGLDS